MDKILKGLMFNDEVSVTLIESTKLINEAITIHKLSPLSAATLGRTMTAVCFMATNLKNEGDNLSVTINGDGVGGPIVVCADNHFNIRGYIENPQADLPLKSNGKLDVGGCVGNGRMTVVRNLGLKEPYTGSCRLQTGEIAEDFAAYFTYSEQQPTGISLGVKIGTDYKCVGGGGLVIQPMPNASEESLDKAEELLSKFNNISTMIENVGIDGIVKEFFSGVKFTEYKHQYHCNCSKEYVDRILITLGKKELYETIEKEGKVEVICHFCPKKYQYNKEDIDKLFDYEN